MKYKTAILLLSTLFLGFSSPKIDIKTEFYHKLQFLKDSKPPEIVKMILFKNITTGKSQLSRGILFTYKNRKSAQVHISGNFSNWDNIEMTRGNNGVWYYFLSFSDALNENMVKYKFNVDGIWIKDPKNPEAIDDGIGSYVSVFDFIKDAENTHVTYRLLQKNHVEFRIFNPKARFVTVVGDFNNWNPENDLLKKGADGIWRLMKHLPQGKYLYKFIIDGKWTPDIYNSNSASDLTGEICSVLKVD